MAKRQAQQPLLTNDQIKAMIDEVRHAGAWRSFDSHQEAAQAGFITARYIEDHQGMGTSQARVLRRALIAKHGESRIVVDGVKCKAATVNASAASA
jgi:hypothetical protein